MALILLLWLLPPVWSWIELGSNFTVDETVPPDLTINLNVWSTSLPQEADKVRIFPKEVVNGTVQLRYSPFGLLTPCVPMGDFFDCEFPEDIVYFPSVPDSLPVTITFQPIWPTSDQPLIFVIEVQADDTLPLHLVISLWHNKATTTPVLPPAFVTPTTIPTATSPNVTPVMIPTATPTTVPVMLEGESQAALRSTKYTAIKPTNKKTDSTNASKKSKDSSWVSLTVLAAIGCVSIVMGLLLIYSSRTARRGHAEEAVVMRQVHPDNARDGQHTSLLADIVV